MASRAFLRAPASGRYLRPARLQTLVCLFAALAPVTAFTNLRRVCSSALAATLSSFIHWSVAQYARAATLPASGYQFQPAAFSIPHRDKVPPLAYGAGSYLHLAIEAWRLRRGCFLH
jgi:hypothetical protein